MDSLPIGDYALLSDCRSAALVSRDGWVALDRAISLVYRYLARDGLPGGEGTFLLCTFWLAQAQAMAGDTEAATATFGRAVAAINDVGLLAEEIGPGGEQAGNFPRAFSHIGLVNAAWAITQAQQQAAVSGPGRGL
ncbi:MAG TPA: glycoside hydrolase family 15 protein [Streptosporangiaceae bacterium]|jgi:GH15 family glucan-1,4-alpha-glucosidase